tara:strand:- start:128 stop:268 length:141 start_codon:yes stop_codon:yes gene_type:complete
MNKTEHIKFRIDKKSKDLITKKAESKGMTTAGYIRSLALKDIQNDK